MEHAQSFWLHVWNMPMLDVPYKHAKVFVSTQQAAAPKPEDPYKERKVNLGTKLRDVIFALRNDPTTPNPANKAMETAVRTPFVLCSHRRLFATLCVVLS